MFAALSRALPRAGLLAIVAFATFTVNTASAVDLGHHDPGEIRKTCAANDGTYYDVGNAYGCQGKGGLVSCDSHNNCKGYCKNCDSVKGTGGVKGVVGGAGTEGNATGTVRAHDAPRHTVKPVTATSHPPRQKIASRIRMHAH